MGVSEQILRILLGFFVLFVLTRILGRKEISQLTFFNYVSAIAIGSLAGNFVLNSDVSFSNGMLALIGWAIITLLLAFIDIKFKNIRRFTSGEPIIVIKEGKIMEHALRRTQLDMDSLSSMLRDKNIFTLNDVEFAIFETNGKLSVMKKDSKLSVTKEDLNISTHYKKYPTATEVISDGIVNSSNLSKLNLDETWLENQLKNLGINSTEEVFYAEIQQDGSFYIDSKDDRLMN